MCVLLRKKGPYVKIFEFEFKVVSEKARLADSKSGFVSLMHQI